MAVVDSVDVGAFKSSPDHYRADEVHNIRGLLLSLSALHERKANFKVCSAILAGEDGTLMQVLLHICSQ